MILKGSQRAGANQLASHMLNDRDNDHVKTLDLRGFVASDLQGALAEAHAIAKATKCKQFLFSLSLNPPKDTAPGEKDFVSAADKIEQSLGLAGQPRAIVIHEKEGRRHAHVVWSRIDGEKLTAKNLPFFKNKLSALSKELFLEHGWTLPDGLKANGGKNPLNFTRDEWQQAQRQKLDPREIKAVFQEAWKRSDTLKALGNALAERGYFLAKGDRRGFVAVDVQGEVYALSKWAGVRAKDVREKLGSPNELEGVSAVKDAVRARVTKQLKSFIKSVKDKQARDLQPLQSEKTRLVERQRKERTKLARHQDQRWQAEHRARSERFRKGLMGVVDFFTGRSRAIRKENEAHAMQCMARDRGVRDDLARAHLAERQRLQERFDELRLSHRQERKLLARDVTQFLRDAERRQKSAARSDKDHAHGANRPNLHPQDHSDRKRGPDLSR
ncbi:MAG: relaxase/mobilization nuclease domain-containing protein [Rhodobacter sp.]|nr:relaxase/mobilization nuclease domain-containing protein [Rhodobacter sp.]